MTVTADPFHNLVSPGLTGVVIPLVWLAPALLAGLWFARRGCWLQASGAALFAFVSVTLLSYNMNWGPAGFLFTNTIRE
jgi:hypothetical protein